MLHKLNANILVLTKPYRYANNNNNNDLFGVSQNAIVYMS